jgi:cellobionic acid phosphorylase
MIPGPSEEDYVQRGQLPVYIPNYYRGGWKTYPRTAGRSSQLFNTGTVSWVYRCLVEGLCGLRGEKDGLSVHPQLPTGWDRIKVTRGFRGATFEVEVKRADVKGVTVTVDGKQLDAPKITGIEKGKTYQVQVSVP